MRDRNPLTHYLTGAALLLCCAVLAFGQCACTYNHITFETDCVRFTDKLVVEPGQGSGDLSDTGANADGAGVGGTGKMSPGGSNLLDGSFQFALVIQQGGESSPTTDAKVDATVTP